MRSAGERARHLLESTEQNAREQLMRTHGTTQLASGERGLERTRQEGR